MKVCTSGWYEVRLEMVLWREERIRFVDEREKERLGWGEIELVLNSRLSGCQAVRLLSFHLTPSIVIVMTKYFKYFIIHSDT